MKRNLRNMATYTVKMFISLPQLYKMGKFFDVKKYLFTNYLYSLLGDSFILFVEKS